MVGKRLLPSALLADLSFVAERLAAIEEFLVGDHTFRFHLELHAAAVGDSSRQDVVGEELDHGPLVPRCPNRDELRFGFVAIFDERQFARAVVREIDSRRCESDFLAFDQDHRARRIGLNHQTATHAACLRQHCEAEQGDGVPSRPVQQGAGSESRGFHAGWRGILTRSRWAGVVAEKFCCCRCHAPSIREAKSQPRREREEVRKGGDGNFRAVLSLVQF